MKDYLDLLVSILTLLTLASGLYFAIRRFGLTRERYTFLDLTVSAATAHKTKKLSLVVITVHIDNKGNTRISARRVREEDGFLYNVGPDSCLHAGTLKIRAIPQERLPMLFDWYSLLPLKITTRLVPAEKMIVSDADLEQINYLDEYQDPVGSYKEVDFWVEPHESYDMTVPIWFTPGLYAAKVYFLGPETRHGEEEYWSSLTIFRVDKQEPPAAFQRKKRFPSRR